MSLEGRTALVTGVSRRAGIGFAIARRLVQAGATVFALHHVPHDAERGWSLDDLPAVLADAGVAGDAAATSACPACRSG